MSPGVNMGTVIEQACYIEICAVDYLHQGIAIGCPYKTAIIFISILQRMHKSIRLEYI